MNFGNSTQVTLFLSLPLATSPQWRVWTCWIGVNIFGRKILWKLGQFPIRWRPFLGRNSFSGCIRHLTQYQALQLSAWQSCTNSRYKKPSTTQETKSISLSTCIYFDVWVLFVTNDLPYFGQFRLQCDLQSFLFDLQRWQKTKQYRT